MVESSFLHPTRSLELAGITEGMRVVDFGSGSGFFTRAAARLVGPEGEVWAVDLHPELLVRTKNLALAEGLQNVEVMRGDIEKPRGSNLPDLYADFGIVSNVLFSVDHKMGFMREVERVLAPGGHALVIDWRASFGGLGPHPSHVITIGAVRDVCESAGLQYVRDSEAGEYHWGFIVRKKNESSAQ